MSHPGAHPRTCRVCGEQKTVSAILGVCVDCIRDRPEEALPHINEAHRKARAPYGLPPEPPRAKDGVKCLQCANRCRIAEGGSGYCGLRWNEGGELRSDASPEEGLLHMYVDPHPTNCCSAWFCPGGTGSGYPRYAYLPGVERGFVNLSVFLYGCNFDCLFCQNASHKQLDRAEPTTVNDLSSRVLHDDRVSCICYFGGSPEPQMPFTVNASRRVAETTGDRVVRLCWEWNGCGAPRGVRDAAGLALESGGNLKFDLKCSDPNLSLALSGVPNRAAYMNFEMVARKFIPERPELPVLTATTLLVPGYVDAREVEGIAGFIAGLDESIPYSLLLFHPDYAMTDLPYTSLRQAVDCYRAARGHLRNVHVGNLPMLGLSIQEFTRLAGF